MKPVHLLFLLVLFLVSCDKNIYKIKIQITDNGLKRELVCYRKNDDGNIIDFPSGELKRIRKIYNPEFEENKADKINLSTEHSFVADFSAKMPQDIGGFGSITRFNSILGSVIYYQERFRKSDSGISEKIKIKYKNADRFADYLAGWLKKELSNEKDWELLDKFVNFDFRKDLKDIVSFIILMNIMNDAGNELKSAVTDQLTARILLFLNEKNYIKKNDIMTFNRIFNSMKSDSEKYKIAISYIIKMISRKTGLPQTSPVLLSLSKIIATEKSLTASLESYIITTEDWRNYLKETRKLQDKDNEKQKPPRPIDMIETCLSALYSIDFDFSTNDCLQIEIYSLDTPYKTNMQWLPEEKKLTWENSLYKKNYSLKLSPFVYAVWVIPNKKVQKHCFGKIAVNDDLLIQYALWENSIDENNKKIWKSFIRSYSSDKNLKNMVDIFKKRKLGKPDNFSSNWANQGCHILQKALN